MPFVSGLCCFGCDTADRFAFIPRCRRAFIHILHLEPGHIRGCAAAAPEGTADDVHIHAGSLGIINPKGILLLAGQNRIDGSGLSVFEDHQAVDVQLDGIVVVGLDVDRIAGVVVAAVGELWEEVKPLGEWLIKVFAKGIVGILTLIGYVFAGIAWAINKIGAAFDWVSGVIDDLREMFNDLLTWIKDNLSLEGIKKNLGKLGDIAVDFLVNKYKGTDPDMAAGAGVVNNANANSLNQTNNQDITVNVYGDNVDPNAVGQSVGRNVGRANNQLLDYAYTAMNGAM